MAQTEEKKNLKSDDRNEAQQIANPEPELALGNKNADPEIKELQKKLLKEDLKFLEEASTRLTIMRHLIQDVLLIAGVGGAILGATLEFVLSKVRQEEITASKLLKGSFTGSGIGISLYHRLPIERKAEA